MFGYPASEWHEKFDPESLRMEFVDSLNTCILDDAMQAVSLKLPDGVQEGPERLVRGSGSSSDPMVFQ
jgi:hypothetical protein